MCRSVSRRRAGSPDLPPGFVARVADGIREGKSMQQLIDAKPFEKWEGSQAPGEPIRIYVEQFYREFSRK
ncbi:MAG: hypothetical protein H7Y89_09725 [Steroidobacteraceae bacterium]|nr:hypothetical protein [Steroidobacteraceae bacterium]